NNWGDANNWSGTSLAANDSLIFDGSTRLSSVNDTTAGTTYSNITFNPSAGTFVLSGKAVTFAAGHPYITNSSASSATVNLGLNFSSDLAFDGGTAGLVIGGGLTDTFSGVGSTFLTLSGKGILTNVFSSLFGGTNVINVSGDTADWTLVDNSGSTTVGV